MPGKCSCHGLHVAVTVFVLYFFYFSVVCYKLLSLFSFSGSFLSILLMVFFSNHRSFNRFSQKDVLFTEFRFLEYFFNFSIVVLCTKSNCCLLKTMAIFLNFFVKTALI